MSGLFYLTVQEARGFSAIPADLDRLAVVMGCSSTGSGFSSFYLSGSSAVSGVSYGDGPDTLCQIIEQRQSGGGSGIKFPAAMYTVPGSTAGSYGTIDNSDVTGTARFAVDATFAPFGTYEVRIKWITGCTIGVTGGQYQWSLDGGRTYSNTKALGTDTFILIPNSNVRLTIGPSSSELTALYTKVTLLQTTLTGTGHFTITSGSPAVHASSDTADDTALAAVPAATTPATGVTLFNACLSYLAIHVASAVYHTTADAVAVAALAAISVAVNIEDVDLRLPALIAAYNAHRILVGAGPVHGSADATNTITAYTAAPGTLIAGDIGAVRTLAPQPSTSDVDAAFVALAAAPGDFTILVCEFPANAAMLAHITTGLNTLRDVAGKLVTAVVRSRLPDFEASESDATWNASVAANVLAFSDSRIHMRATYELITDAMTTRQYLRSDLAQFAADLVRVGRADLPGVPADVEAGIANSILSDASGALVGHDEGTRGASTGLSNDTLGNRFGCQQRFPDPLRREAVYNTVPWVLFASDERIRNVAVRRTVNALERNTKSVALGALGGRLAYIPADPNVPGSLPMLTEASRGALHAKIFDALSEAFANDIGNANDADGDTGLVQIAKVVTVSGGNLISGTVTLAPLFDGVLLSLTVIVSVKQ